MNETKKEKGYGGSDFLITVYHEQGNSIQGVVQRLDNGQRIAFRSALELMNLIAEGARAPEHRTWQDAVQIRVV